MGSATESLVSYALWFSDHVTKVSLVVSLQLPSKAPLYEEKPLPCLLLIQRPTHSCESYDKEAV